MFLCFYVNLKSESTKTCLFHVNWCLLFPPITMYNHNGLFCAWVRTSLAMTHQGISHPHTYKIFWVTHRVGGLCVLLPAPPLPRTFCPRLVFGGGPRPAALGGLGHCPALHPCGPAGGELGPTSGKAALRVTLVIMDYGSTPYVGMALEKWRPH